MLCVSFELKEAQVFGRVVPNIEQVGVHKGELANGNPTRITIEPNLVKMNRAK